MQAEIDTSKPHAARMYDYLLGGKDHFAIDRETAEKGIKLIPTGRTAARENRTFLGRAVRYLVAEAGILHFIPDELNPGRAVATLVDALPSGSYVTASHGSPEFNPEGAAAWSRTWQESGVPFQLRTTDEVADLVFRGLDMVEPGLVVV